MKLGERQLRAAKSIIAHLVSHNPQHDPDCLYITHKMYCTCSLWDTFYMAREMGLLKDETFPPLQGE